MPDQTLQALKTILSSIGSDPRGTARLPTERELAETVGVNRSTLRERLAALESLGLIRRTQGSGTYLALPDPSFVQFYFEMALQLGYFTLEQLEQARELLEREVAYSAALRATPQDVKGLEEGLTGILEADNAEDAADLDYQFHMCLARASHNPVILLIVEGLSSVLRQVFRFRQRLARSAPEGEIRTNRVHIPIVEAVRSHDPGAAVAAMDDHFTVWNEVSEKASARLEDAVRTTETDHEDSAV